MNKRNGGYTLIFSLLLAGSLNAQNYVLEWQSPEGRDLANFMRIEDSFWETLRFDMEGDGILEIWARNIPNYDSVYVYDGATHDLKWNFSIPPQTRLLGFWDFDGDGLKEALFDNFNKDYLFLVNWETSEVEFTLEDTLLGIAYRAKSAFDIDNDGKYELIVQKGNTIEIWGDGSSVAPDFDYSTIRLNNEFVLTVIVYVNSKY